MKQKRMLALLLCLTVCLGALTGCGGKKEGAETPAGQSDASVQTSDAAAEDSIVYVATYHDLPEDFSASDRMVLLDGTLYAASYGVIGEREPTEEELRDFPNEDWIYEQYGSQLHAVALTEGYAVTQLENYTPVPVPEGENGSSYCQGILTGADRTLWVVENLYTYTDTDYSEVYYLRRLDLTGKELQSIPLDFLGEGKTMQYMACAAADADGNLYFAGGNSLVVTDAAGQMLFSIDMGDDWIDQLVELGDGTVGACLYDYNSAQGGYQIRTVDKGARGWAAESLPLPENCYSAYAGVGDYAVLTSDGSDLYGLNARTGEYEKLLNWVDCDISNDQVEGVYDLGNGNLGVTLFDWSTTQTHSYLAELVPTPASQVPQKTVLTLGCAYASPTLSRAVVYFNRQSQAYHISVLDYSTKTDETDSSGLDLLKYDLLTGNAPDLVDLSDTEYTDLLIRKGVLEDLTPYLEADPTLSAEDLMPCYLSAASKDGKLYQVYSGFSVATVLGRKDVVGTKTGWTWEDLNALAQANPDTPLFSPFTSQEFFLQQMAVFSLGDYVNWADGTCNFEDQAFLSMLEFAATLPAEANYDTDEWTQIMNGDQLLSQVSIGSFDDVSMYATLFGGEVTYVGFPGGAGNGSSVSASDFSLAMTAACTDKTAAWEFMRMLLSEDYQEGGYSTGWSDFYTNRAALEQHIQEYQDTNVQYDADGNLISTGGIGWGEGAMLDTYPATTEQIEAFLAAAEGAEISSYYDTELLNIITEEAGAFFAGQRTAADTASIIQGRAAIYLSEQN